MNFLNQRNCKHSNKSTEWYSADETNCTTEIKSKDAPISSTNAVVFRAAGDGSGSAQPALCTPLVLGSKHCPTAAWLLPRAEFLATEVSTRLNTSTLSDVRLLITAMPLSELIFVAAGTRRQNSDANLVVSRSLHLTWSDLFGLQHMSVLMCPFIS
jgi:hypothetical protein